MKTTFHSGLKNDDVQTSSSQVIGAAKVFDAFGNVISSSGDWKSQFGYAGSFGYQKDLDASLHLLGHRYYDSSTGRFLTRDPVKDGRNWYVYCSNRPITSADPTGLLRTDHAQGVAVLVDTSTGPAAAEVAAGGISRLPPFLKWLVAALAGTSQLTGSDEDRVEEPAVEPAPEGEDVFPSEEEIEEAQEQVEKELGEPLGQPNKDAKPRPGKLGEWGNSKKGARLDEPHPTARGRKGKDAIAETWVHFNWWDYTDGKRGGKGRQGVVPIIPERYRNSGTIRGGRPR